MKVLILNGSPKRKTSASGLLGKMAGLLLPGCQKSYASLRRQTDYPEIFQQLKQVEAVLLTVPLYVDGIPSHVLEFLQQAEQFCLENRCRFTLYVVANNGFIEGSHNRVHLRMYQCWCRRTGVTWGGGLGIGGGEMFHAVTLCMAVALAVQTGLRLVSYLAGTAPALAHWQFALEDVITYLLLHCGILYCLARLCAAVRQGKQTKDRFTRVMVPALLFIPITAVFMSVSALLHGKLIFPLLKQDSYQFPQQK